MKLNLNMDHLKHKVFKITFKSAQKYAAKKARNETIGLSDSLYIVAYF